MMIKFWMAFATIIIIINVTVMVMMVTDNTAGAHHIIIEKIAFIIIDDTRNITYIYWQYL